MEATAPREESTPPPPLFGSKTWGQRAPQPIEKGAVTSGHTADRQNVIETLNRLLATELVCVLRYKRRYFMAAGFHGVPVATEFLEHAADEMAHADRIAKRIIELGGQPNFSPDGLVARNHLESIEGVSLKSVIAENLVAERIAVETYRQAIAHLGNRDPTARRLLEEILASEEEHGEELLLLLQRTKDRREA